MSTGPLDGITILDLSIAADGTARVRAARRPGRRGGEGRTSGHRRHRPLGRRVGQRYERALRGVQPREALHRGRRAHRRRPRASCCGSPADADVFVQNFRPGVIDRRGLGYEDRAGGEPRRRLRVALRIRAGRTRTRASRRTTPSSRPTAGSPPSRPIRPTATRCSCGRPPPTRSPRSPRRRRSPPRCFAASAGAAASTWSCRCSTPSCRSCGPTPRATRCSWTADGTRTVELRADVPAVPVPRRVGHRHAHERRRLRRHHARARRSRGPTTRGSRRSRERVKHRELVEAR